jgi:Fe2+ or Zn2+ uptake regulation protein
MLAVEVGLRSKELAIYLFRQVDIFTWRQIVYILEQRDIQVSIPAVYGALYMFTEFAIS